MLESLFNKEAPTWMFSCEYFEILKNTFFEELLRTAASVTSISDIFRTNVEQLLRRNFYVQIENRY